MNIAHLLTQQAKERPEAVAIIEKGRQMTFRQLADAASRACAVLRQDEAVNPGDHVLILTPMSIDLYVALIAVFQLGAVATFLDPSAGVGHINHCCEIARPVALIGPRKVQLLRWAVKGLRRIRYRYTVAGWFPFTRRWPGTTGGDAVRDQDLYTHAREDTDPALVTFTSGSTGRPKAAVRSHGFLRAQHLALAPAIDLVPGEVDLATLPIFTLANLASGVTTLIPDADLRRVGQVDPLPIRRQIEQHHATRATASPAFLKKLVEGGVTLSAFTKVYTGGAPILPGFLDELTRAMPSARVVAVYGSTEAEPVAHIGRDEMTPGDIAAMYRGAGLLAGKPVHAVQVRIIQAEPAKPLGPMIAKEFDAITTPNQPGEIVVTGDHVLKGYLGGIGEEQTKFQVDGQVWHRTGDAGYLDTDGRLWLLGRAEARITDAHGTVFPFAVECAASAVPGVRRSALIAHQGKRYLIVEQAGLARFDESVLRAKLAWAKLDVIRRVPRIPLDKRHNAKVDYPALRQLLG